MAFNDDMIVISGKSTKQSKLQFKIYFPTCVKLKSITYQLCIQTASKIKGTYPQPHLPLIFFFQTYADFGTRNLGRIYKGFMCEVSCTNSLDVNINL